MSNKMDQMQKVFMERPQGALPSNTEPNPREQVNSIMTRSGLTTAEPSIPPHVPPTPRVEVEKEPETLMDEVHITSPASTAHVPPPGVQPVSPPKPKEDPKPNPHQPKIPYPSRLNKTKLLDKNDVQISKFLKILKQLHFDISLMDALTQIPKFTKVLKDLLKDKEKLEELANTPINAECSAILLNKVPEKLEDPGKFLIPCILQDLEVYNSLADSGASINLMPLSIFEKLRIGPLKPTRMTLELANRSITFSIGIPKDVIIKVEKFNFFADFIIVDFEAVPRVPIILGRPFLRTARALVDLYEEKLTLRVGNEEVVFYTDKSSRNNSSNIQSVHCINIIDFSRDKPISGSTTFPSDSSPSSPLVETSDSLFEEFVNELALLDQFLLGNKDDKSEFDVRWSTIDVVEDVREIELEGGRRCEDGMAAAEVCWVGSLALSCSCRCDVYEVVYVWSRRAYLQGDESFTGGHGGIADVSGGVRVLDLWLVGAERCCELGVWCESLEGDFSSKRRRVSWCAWGSGLVQIGRGQRIVEEGSIIGAPGVYMRDFQFTNIPLLVLVMIPSAGGLTEKFLSMDYVLSARLCFVGIDVFASVWQWEVDGGGVLTHRSELDTMGCLVRLDRWRVDAQRSLNARDHLYHLMGRCSGWDWRKVWEVINGEDEYVSWEIGGDLEAMRERYIYGVYKVYTGSSRARHTDVTIFKKVKDLLVEIRLLDHGRLAYRCGSCLKDREV
ncbi:reverse transcriptase domain-containing protein [Tanacetum coccineum]